MGLPVKTPWRRSTHRNPSVTDGQMSKSRKVSSGSSINRAADGAAGLPIPKGLSSQIGGLKVAVRKIQMQMVQPKEDLDRIANKTTFNSKRLLGRPLTANSQEALLATRFRTDGSSQMVSGQAAGLRADAAVGGNEHVTAITKIRWPATGHRHRRVQHHWLNRHPCQRQGHGGQRGSGAASRRGTCAWSSARRHSPGSSPPWRAR